MRSASKYYGIGGVVTFLVIFNLGYVFHEIAAGPWMHARIGSITRDAYIIPAIAIAFVFYIAIMAYLMPVFFAHAARRHGWSLVKTGVLFGALMGFFWDGLQGGLIEFATFRLPFEVFAVDSSYHVLEGALTGFLLALFYKRYGASPEN